MDNKKIAFVFPGQGSQYIGMGKEVYENFVLAKETFQEASEVLGYDVAKLAFEGPEQELNKTFRTQPCILTTSIALYKILFSKSIKPSVVLGHSLGEYTALVVADVLCFKDTVRLTEKRGQFMQEAVPEGKGLMAAILGLDRNRVDEICKSLSKGYASPANYNSPRQIVIAGERTAVEEAITLCKEAGAKRALPLSVSVPSHCKLMEPASKRLAELFEDVKLNHPKIPFVNNADARFIDTIDNIKASLIRQIMTPLLWEDSIKKVIEYGVKIFIEVGPGRVLSGLIKRISPDVSILNVEDLKTLELTISNINK